MFVDSFLWSLFGAFRGCGAFSRFTCFYVRFWGNVAVFVGMEGLVLTKTTSLLIITYTRRGGRNCIVRNRVTNVRANAVCLGYCQGKTFRRISSTTVRGKGFAFGNASSRPLTCTLAAIGRGGHPRMFFLDGRDIRIGLSRVRGRLRMSKSPRRSLCTRCRNQMDRSTTLVSDLFTHRSSSPIDTCLFMHGLLSHLSCTSIGTCHSQLSTSLRKARCIHRVSTRLTLLSHLRMNTRTPSFALPSTRKGSIHLSSFHKGCMLVSF